MRKGVWIMMGLTMLAGCEAYRTFRDVPPIVRSSAIAPEPGLAVTDSGPSTRPTLTTQPSESLTLDEAIDRALARYGRVRIADRRILIAQDQVREAWAVDLPKLTAQGRFDIFEKQNPLSALGGAAGATSAAGRTGIGTGGVRFRSIDRDVASGSLSLLVPVYNFGLGYHQREAARIGVDVARLTAERTRQDLALNVSLSYFRVLEAQKIRDVVLESIQTVTRQLEIARDFLNQGLVAKNDVLVAEVQLAQRRQELIQAENNIQLAMATLNRLMDEPMTRRWRLRDILEVAPWRGSFESVFFLAVQRRPDLTALRRQIELIEQQYRTTRATLAPQINAYVNYTYTDQKNLVDKDSAAGGLVADWSLFDGGLTYAQLARLSKQINEAIDQQSEAEKDVILEVKQGYLNLNDAAERIPVAKKSIELAEENLRITRDQYAQGLLTSEDVLLQEERLARARSSYYQALYGYHQSFATLINATGAVPAEVSTTQPVAFREQYRRVYDSKER